MSFINIEDLITVYLIKKCLEDDCDQTCLHYHPNSGKKQRRQPLRRKSNGEIEFAYIDELCENQEDCDLGDDCPYAHNNYEQKYHPMVIKSMVCLEKQNCECILVNDKSFDNDDNDDDKGENCIQNFCNYRHTTKEQEYFDNNYRKKYKDSYEKQKQKLKQSQVMMDTRQQQKKKPNLQEQKIQADIQDNNTTFCLQDPNKKPVIYRESDDSSFDSGRNSCISDEGNNLTDKIQINYSTNQIDDKRFDEQKQNNFLYDLQEINLTESQNHSYCIKQSLQFNQDKSISKVPIDKLNELLPSIQDSNNRVYSNLDVTTSISRVSESKSYEFTNEAKQDKQQDSKYQMSQYDRQSQIKSQKNNGERNKQNETKYSIFESSLQITNGGKYENSYDPKQQKHDNYTDQKQNGFKYEKQNQVYNSQLHDSERQNSNIRNYRKDRLSHSPNLNRSQIHQQIPIYKQERQIYNQAHQDQYEILREKILNYRFIYDECFDEDEGSLLEFKDYYFQNQLSQDEIPLQGGFIILGIKDDKKIKGSQINFNQFMEYLTPKLKQCYPAILDKQQIKQHKLLVQRSKDSTKTSGQLFVIEVIPQKKQKIYFTYDHQYYQRSFSSTLKYEEQNLIKQIKKKLKMNKQTYKEKQQKKIDECEQKYKQMIIDKELNNDEKIRQLEEKNKLILQEFETLINQVQQISNEDELNFYKKVLQDKVQFIQFHKNNK